MRAAIEVMGEEGYEGASMRDMAARGGVTVAALYHHFPSKQELLREFVDEAYDITIARVERRMKDADPAPAAQLDEIVGTLIASHLHDDFAQLASNVAFREYTRLDAPERAAVDAKRAYVLDLVENVVADGVATGAFTTREPREAARAVVTLSTSLVEHNADIGRPMAEVISLYQRFARGIACS